MYISTDIAFVIPTRDRPEKIRNLLDSFISQPRCGKIIIVDSGVSIQHILCQYMRSLPIEYYQCNQSGQIAQRNYGISLLDDSTPLVGCLDDDIVLEAGCIDAMIHLWNRVDATTAALGFRITNQPPSPTDFFRRVTLQVSKIPGKVLSSGVGTNYHDALSDMRTEWLCGGAAVWRLSILKGNQHAPVKVRWAIGEDLIYSYPIGRRYSLFVCASAKVKHEHFVDCSAKRSKYYHGLIQTLMRLWFVYKNQELSKFLFAYSVLSASFGKIFLGIVFLRHELILFGMGQLHGLVGGVLALATKNNFLEYIAHQDERFS